MIKKLKLKFCLEKNQKIKPILLVKIKKNKCFLANKPSIKNKAVKIEIK